MLARHMMNRVAMAALVCKSIRFNVFTRLAARSAWPPAVFADTDDI